MHENRETSEMPAAKHCGRTAREGSSRTARMYIFEESDSGIIPMNHSNKDGKPYAESEEGRPLIKGQVVNDRPRSANRTNQLPSCRLLKS
jgi:hypothetical protein